MIHEALLYRKDYRESVGTERHAMRRKKLRWLRYGVFICPSLPVAANNSNFPEEGAGRRTVRSRTDSIRTPELKGRRAAPQRRGGKLTANHTRALARFFGRLRSL